MPNQVNQPNKLQPPPAQTYALTDLPAKPSSSGFVVPWLTWFQSIYNVVLGLVAANNQKNILAVPQASLPTNLTSANAGQLVWVSDYNHVLEWTGTGWSWGPGELGSGYIQPFGMVPTNPAGWHVCDGSTVSYLKSNGTLGSAALPNLATAAYLKLATALAIGPNAASGESEAVSAGTPTGTNSSGITGTESADQTVGAGIGATVAAQNHTHTVAAQLFTGAPMGTHQHGPGTLDLENTQLLAYFRQ